MALGNNNPGAMDSRLPVQGPPSSLMGESVQLSDEERLRQRYLDADRALEQQSLEPSAVDTWGVPLFMASSFLGMAGPVGAAAAFALGNTAMNYATRKDQQRAAPLNNRLARFKLAQDFEKTRLGSMQYGSSSMDRDIQAIMRNSGLSYAEAAKEYRRNKFGGGAAAKLVADPALGTMVKYDPGSGGFVDTGIPISSQSMKVQMVNGVPMIEVVTPDGQTALQPLSQYPDLARAYLSGEEQQTQIAADREETVGNARSFGTFSAEQEQEATTQLETLYSQAQNTRDLLYAFESGGFQDTGYVEGQLKKYTNPETGRLAMYSTFEVLSKLASLTLTPVSDPDIRMLRETYADVQSDPEVNYYKLQAALAFIEDRIEKAERFLKYVDSNNGSARGYRPDPRPKSMEAFIKEYTPQVRRIEDM